MDWYNKCICFYPTPPPPGSRIILDCELRCTRESLCSDLRTMNPGYLGRSEHTEGLKALFRSKMVVVPDLVLICDNMRVSEGFVTSKTLCFQGQISRQKRGLTMMGLRT